MGRMLWTFLLFSVPIACLADDYPYSSFPNIVKEEIESNKKSCAPDVVSMEAGFVTKKDINGDKLPDYILDYGKFKCGSLSSTFCGSGGCLTQVFASLPNGSYVTVLNENVRGLSFRKIKGRSAMIIDLHGIACGRPGYERCEAVLYWNGWKFSPAN